MGEFEQRSRGNQFVFQDIHHVAIICSDYQKSKRFYVETLGLEVVREIYRQETNSFKLDLKLGKKYRLELFSFPNPPKRVSSPEACGLRHLAFEVENVEEVARHLAAQDIQFETIRVDEYTSKRFTFFRDPDNLPIEIYER